MHREHLEIVQSALRALSPAPESSSYRVPRMWVDEQPGAIAVDPVLWHLEQLGELLASPSADTAVDWHREAVVYNLFVRFGCAFDHDGDGRIAPEPLASGFRETGTLLKAIAMLPYIKKLGANTIYLLPLTTIGEKERKGTLGSPYAVQDPLRLDPMLAEPALGLQPETLLKAFIEAAHLQGMHVVLEFVFRTASVDSRWIGEHPEWFYWLKESVPPESYGPPHFQQDTLNEIYSLVDRHEMEGLPAPSESYRNQFARHPVTAEPQKEGGYRGIDADGEACRIASAFSDWPPDDRQPAWTDVTYLRMHTPPEFDYIAYNTIRMYDAALTNPETHNTGLWEEISGIIPRFQREYGIDGAMMDMGHALPAALKKEIVTRARKTRPDFVFWDENFDPTPAIRDEGFNAVFGSFPFVVSDIIYIRGLLNFLNKTGVALPFFGTGENHNTPRVPFRYGEQEAGRSFSTFIFTLSAVLPAVPFIHSGMEILEWRPVNLGLNFNDEDRAMWPPETLPLFSAASFDWERTNSLQPLNGYVKKVLDVRSRHLDIILSGEQGSLVIPIVSDEAIFALKRTAGGRSLLFIGNSCPSSIKTGHIEFKKESGALEDLLTGEVYRVESHRLELTLEPGRCRLFLLPDEN
ncbi:MAG: alpha-amylase [Pelodictyon luteolum]|uniref:Alpha-amylase n=1 Tax=Pelodictyon luteolum TaxID=1100 RepID=A0A165MHJ0_PELLU|nr:alpha-amylase [Pelodictyon luteolum]KZK75253.1 MAG: alpha-amylase [Pelodictyon luteolum]